MFPAQDFFVFRAEQNIHDVTRAKFLVRASDTGEEFLRINGDIRQWGGGRGTVVATGTIVGLERFTKVLKEWLTATASFIFRILHDGIQMLHGNPFFAALFLVNKITDLGYIRVTVKQKAMSGQSVAARTSDFLIITFDTFGQIKMDHET